MTGGIFPKQAVESTDLINFEARVQLLWESGDLPYLTHLSGGNERQLLDIFADIKPGDWIFASHRCHYHYLLAGLVNGKTWIEITAELLDKIRAGQSMFLYSKDYNFLASAICAGNCAIAAGTAWALHRQDKLPNKMTPKPHVWCFLGDGAEDEGHFYEAVRWVASQFLPCTFVIEDNDRSCSTTKMERHGSAFIRQYDLGACVRRYHYKPTWPHAGSGCAHHIQFKTK